MLLLFTRWDRFSRNTADAYNMIRKLNKFNVEPQAIDQPLNLAIPENKIMLALYIVTSEVENDRISLNVKQGMRKAKQEGKWLGQAPIGYQKKYHSNGQTYIEPIEPEATLIKDAFEAVEKGIGNTHFIYRQAIANGLKCSQSHFWRILKNPAYCGQILISASEHETQYTVNGLHEELISFSVFQNVQKILNRKRKGKQAYNRFNENFPLRGYLLCPICEKTITGSRSKGKTQTYNYYHCSQGCKFRIRAEEVNNMFISFLTSVSLTAPFSTMYHNILKDLGDKHINQQTTTKERISKCIEKAISRQVNAYELFLKVKIDHEDYLIIKEASEKDIKKYSKDLHKIAIDNARLEDHHKKNYNLCINKIYEKSDINTKRSLINLLLPNKVILTLEDFSNSFNKYYSRVDIPEMKNDNMHTGSSIISFLEKLAYIEISMV